MNQDIRAPYYGERGRLSFSPGWAQAGARDVAGAATEIQAGGLALCGGQGGARPSRRIRAGRTGGAAQPDHGQPDRGQHLRHQPQHSSPPTVRWESGREGAPHRHTAAALRLVVEAKPGTYTVVDGARVDMVPGDVVLTPSWAWHGHANESDATSYWIDFLDVPFVQHSEAMFFEPNPDGFFLRTITRNGPSPHRIPARDALAVGDRREDRRDRQGVLPTIGLHLMRLPSGTRRRSRRRRSITSTPSSAATRG